MYDIKMLCQTAKISQQTFYRLSRENDDFRAIVEANREKKGNSFYYAAPVLSWLLDYKGAERASIPGETHTTPAEAPTMAPVPPQWEEREKNFLTQIEALQAEIERLNAALEAKEEERKELFTQHSQLLMLFSLEKQEKQALLPAPKKPLSQRIKSLFRKE